MNSPVPSHSRPTTSNPRVAAGVIRGIYLSVCGLALIAEIARWWNPQTRVESLAGWLCGINADWLPYLPLLLTAPLWGRVVSRKKIPESLGGWRSWCRLSAATSSNARNAWGVAGAVFLFALFVSRMAGSEYRGAPPAYHDEYSYLFQAQTYQLGRWWLPSDKLHPEWFDQMHVLNEGHFASRYFPGTGLWMLPFVALGDPWLGHQVAQALCAMLIFWIGRELSNNGTGLFAALLFALSPGLVLFSNLLLAHHPTLVGLLTFTWAFLKWMRCGGSGLMRTSGFGLAFAMICRPMTAAGFALPFGIILAIWIVTGRFYLFRRSAEDVRSPLAIRLHSMFHMVMPLMYGFLLIGISNQAITGSWKVTPYSLYNEIYTPRHRYGFNNVRLGEQLVGPKVLDNYDRWAENLTPGLAIRNVGTRLESSLRWTLGIVPVLLGSLICLLTMRHGDARYWLIASSILSLHLAHVPYWFAGIMGWHYVFESAPLWILLCAEGTRRISTQWRNEGEIGWLWWRNLFVITTLAVNLVTVVPLWPGRLELGLAELGFARNRYRAFREQVDTIRNGQDALVLVLPDPSDRSMDYVTNRPDLSGPVLIARLRDRSEFNVAAEAYPDRVPMVFDAAQRTLTPLR